MSFNQQEYMELRKRYLQPVIQKEAELAGGMILRQKRTTARIDRRGCEHIKEHIRYLEKSNNVTEIFSLLCKLRAFDMGRGTFPLVGHQKRQHDDETDRVVELIDLTHEIEVIDIEQSEQSSSKLTCTPVKGKPAKSVTDAATSPSLLPLLSTTHKAKTNCSQELLVSEDETGVFDLTGIRRKVDLSLPDQVSCDASVSLGSEISAETISVDEMIDLTCCEINVDEANLHDMYSRVVAESVSAKPHIELVDLTYEANVDVDEDHTNREIYTSNTSKVAKARFHGTPKTFEGSVDRPSPLTIRKTMLSINDCTPPARAVSKNENHAPHSKARLGTVPLFPQAKLPTQRNPILRASSSMLSTKKLVVAPVQTKNTFSECANKGEPDVPQNTPEPALHSAQQLPLHWLVHHDEGSQTLELLDVEIAQRGCATRDSQMKSSLVGSSQSLKLAAKKRVDQEICDANLRVGDKKVTCTALHPPVNTLTLSEQGSDLKRKACFNEKLNQSLKLADKEQDDLDQISSNRAHVVICNGKKDELTQTSITTAITTLIASATRIHKRETLSKIATINAMLPCLALNEYDTSLPTTIGRLMIKVKYDTLRDKGVYFDGYDRFPDGLKSRVESQYLFCLSIGDRVIAIDGVGVLHERSEDIITVLRDKGKNHHICIRFRRRQANGTPTSYHLAASSSTHADRRKRSRVEMKRQNVLYNDETEKKHSSFARRAARKKKTRQKDESIAYASY